MNPNVQVSEEPSSSSLLLSMEKTNGLTHLHPPESCGLQKSPHLSANQHPPQELEMLIPLCSGLGDAPPKAETCFEKRLCICK